MSSTLKRSLDELDWKILDALQHDARLSYSEIGRRVGLSAPAVSERVKKMEDAGIITGYRAVVDPEQIGLPIKVFIHLQVDRDRFSEVVDRVRDFPEVLECHRTTGRSSLILKVAVSSIDHMEALIDELMRFGEPVSSIVLSTPIRQRTFHRPAEQSPL